MGGFDSLFGAGSGAIAGGEGLASGVGSAASGASALGSLSDIAKYAQLASTLGGLGLQAYQVGQMGHASPGQPINPLQASGGVGGDPTKLLPGIMANAQARVGGGYSPNFINNLYGQQTGGMDALSAIRARMGQA